MSLLEDWKSVIVNLTGQEIPFLQNLTRLNLTRIFSKPVGYSQLNEILLTLGYDRISEDFFQFLIDGQVEYDYDNPTHIDSPEIFLNGVERFRKTALLKFGNIKYAFKLLSTDPELLFNTISSFEKKNPKEFTDRPDETIPIQKIPATDTYYLGYIVQNEIKNQLEKDPNNGALLKEQEKMKKWCDIGIQNHEAYLTSDYMDVYVATSMRERHEFINVNKITQQIFNHPTFIDKENNSNYKIRYFDPTQAYCNPRIDKGLSEALMLKRAALTIYLVQESDTLGKDSELASTLAQGKPVIAFIPEVTEEYFEEFIVQLKEVYDLDLKEIMLKHIKQICPSLIWDKKEYPNGLNTLEKLPLEEIKAKLFGKMKEVYDKRANTLKNSHPLGIQVHLESGVANGVLVVRSIDDCAHLLKSLLLNNINVEIDNIDDNGSNFLVLKERLSNCIFRVESSDKTLTNSFWNFYL